jgi:hypothetical protein
MVKNPLTWKEHHHSKPFCGTSPIQVPAENREKAGTWRRNGPEGGVEEAGRPEGSEKGGKRSLPDEVGCLEGGVEEAERPEGSGKGEKRSLPDEVGCLEGGVEEAGRPEGSRIREKRSLPDGVDCLEGGEGREMGSSGGFGWSEEWGSCKL